MKVKTMGRRKKNKISERLEKRIRVSFQAMAAIFLMVYFLK
jgi:hypothetical protein